MKNVVMGVFNDTHKADVAIVALKALGYDSSNISVVANDTVRTQITETTVSDADDSTSTGAVAGATLGALAGLLIAVVAPPVGGIILAGPIATALGVSAAAGTAIAGAGVGAAAGGVVGALVGLGLSEDEARIYEERVKNNGVLVAVEIQDENQSAVQNIFTQNGAEEIRTKLGGT